VLGDPDTILDIADWSDSTPLMQPSGRFGIDAISPAARFLPNAEPRRPDPRFMGLCSRVGMALVER
jgi:hypothetical protein